MTDKVVIEWRVADGYVNNGPHATEIYLWDFEDDMDEDAMADQINMIVQEDFEERVEPVVTNMKDAIAEIISELKSREA